MFLSFVLQVWGFAHWSTPERASPCGCVFVFLSGSALSEKTIYIQHLQLRNHQYSLCQACWARPVLFQLFPWLPSHPLQTLAQQHFRTANHEWILVVFQLLYRWAATAGKPLVHRLQRHIHTTGNRKCPLVIEQHLCSSSTRFLFTQLYLRISYVCVLRLLFTSEGNMGVCQGDQVIYLFIYFLHHCSIIPSWGHSSTVTHAS